MNLCKFIFSAFLATTLINPANAQPVEQFVKVVIAPDHSDWTYKTGEQVKFHIEVLKNGNPVKNAIVKYEVGPEKMDPVKKDSLQLKDGSLTVDMPGMKTPGFMRCTVSAWLDGKEYRYWATAAFDPLKIEPTVNDPADFNSFWDSAKQQLAKVPMDSRMVLIPEKCTDLVNVYHVSIQNIGNSRVFGILCVPKKPGKYPAVLRVPGAGIRPYNGDIKNASKGIITLEIGIHGIPVNMPPDVYSNLASGALNGYQYFNLDNRDKYYYKRVYLGCVRANDFLESLPEYDGKTLAVTGGSQGGALSIITAGLDPRVQYLAAFYPAMSDMTGYLKNRAGGWPHIFDKNNSIYNNKKDKIETIAYYDVVNFAKRVKAKGFYSWGFNDNVCPPTSMYASYNVIKAPKQLLLAVETAHWTYPEQIEEAEQWLLDNLK
ncbi:MAG: acetylxylan esterase [Chitinophagaceae bacterium]|nr:acetylxylan esterase [Chitinophagaceae bacterium]